MDAHVAAEDISLDDLPPEAVAAQGRAEGPEFVWAKVAPEDLIGLRTFDVRAEAPVGGERIAAAAVRDIVEEVLRQQGPVARGRDKVTVAEFAEIMNVAQSTVFVWLQLGLPSAKTKGLGRRILRQQAEAWLMASGPERSRTAKRLAKLKANGRG